MIYTRPPRLADLAHVAANMRAMDRAECAMFDLSPADALRESADASRWCVAVFSNDVLICIVGVSPDPDQPGVGMPWLLGIEGIERHARAFAVLTGHIIARMEAEYPRLSNVVHPDNETSIAWLKRAGFEFAEPEPVGDVMALRFWKASGDVVCDCSASIDRALCVR